MSDTVKIRFSISTNKFGSECEDELEFDREYWESLTEHEKEEEVKEYAFQYIEWGFEQVL